MNNFKGKRVGLWKISNIGALPGQFGRGNPCSGLQGFPTELTPRVIPCCNVRIFEECVTLVWPSNFLYSECTSIELTFHDRLIGRKLSKCVLICQCMGVKRIYNHLYWWSWLFTFMNKCLFLHYLWNLDFKEHDKYRVSKNEHKMFSSWQIWPGGLKWDL